MKNITVIGAGTMGNGIAHVFAQKGFWTAKKLDQISYDPQGSSLGAKTRTRTLKFPSHRYNVWLQRSIQETLAEWWRLELCQGLWSKRRRNDEISGWRTSQRSETLWNSNSPQLGNWWNQVYRGGWPAVYQLYCLWRIQECNLYQPII